VCIYTLKNEGITWPCNREEEIRRRADSKADQEEAKQSMEEAKQSIEEAKRSQGERKRSQEESAVEDLE
jgi:hypothetical protein